LDIPAADLLKQMKLKLENNWINVKEKLKEHELALTDEDLEYKEGREEELIERIQNRINMPREEIIKWIESVSANI
jgi:uncharacterized protein YjbJ (UPF0337 family)